MEIISIEELGVQHENEGNFPRLSFFNWKIIIFIDSIKVFLQNFSFAESESKRENEMNFMENKSSCN